MSGGSWASGRVRRLGRGRWRLLARALASLAGANARLTFGSFRRALDFGSVTLGRRDRRVEAAAVVWAVRAAARRVPFRAMCIEQGIAAQRLLRRSGIDARLHYGARPDVADGRLAAHVWVSVDGQVVIGGEEAAEFAEVATFP